MTKHCINYLPATGEIIMNGSMLDSQTEADLIFETGVGMIVADETITYSTHYILDGVPTPKPDLDSICGLVNTDGTWQANGTDTITYGTALPANTTYSLTAKAGSSGIDPFIAPRQGDITTGSFSLTTTRPGIYTIVLKVFPYLDKTITIEAV